MNPYTAPGIGICKTTDEVVALVINTYGVSLNDIRGKSRKQHIKVPRQVLAYLLSHYGLTNEKAGYIINRDHATVNHSIKVVENVCDIDSKFNELIKNLKLRL